MRNLFCFFWAASLALSLAACSPAQPSSKDDGITTIAATTYPLYELAKIVVDGRDNYELKLVVDQEISCLHDYTLSVNDMRVIESADVLLINGVDFEAFMEDVLSVIDVPVIDCSEGIELLPASGHEDHDPEHDGHEHGHYDPHIWLDPWRMRQMLGNIAEGLAEMDSSIHVPSQILMPSAHIDEQALEWKALFDALPEEQKYLITFHDGFSYLADAYGLTILKAIEEEAGSEASAKDIVEIVDLIQEYDIPMIFVEENSSDATAKAIARETGVAIGTLSMLMSDSGRGLSEDMYRNMKTIYEGLSGTEVNTLGE